MRKNLIFFSSGIAFFLLFVVFSYLVHKNLFMSFDFDATVRLQNNIPRRFDDIFSFFSSIGSFEPMLIVLVITLVLWRKIITGVAVLIAFLGFHGFEIFGKYFVNHLPPPEFMLRTKRLVDFPQFHIREQFSYPSGHSGRAIFIGTLLIFIIWHSKRLSQSMKILFSCCVVGYVVVMLVSRVYLGEHWTTDIIGGALISFSLIMFALTTYQLKEKFVNHNKMIKKESVAR